MTARDAFVAGYAAPAAGLYFNGVELLSIADRASDLDLAKQVSGERDRVVGLRDRSLAYLDEAEDAMARLGATVPERPDDSRGFEAWAEAVFAAVDDALADGSAESVAHLLGFVMGEAIATLDVLAILSRLREHTPDDLWMRAQGESLEQERARAERRLARLAAHDLLPHAAQVAAGLAGHAVSDAAPSGGHATRAQRAARAADTVGEQARAAEAALS